MRQAPYSDNYSAKHKRVSRTRGAARNYPCADECGRQAMDWALIHGRDGRDPDSYRPLCRSCHMVYDQVGNFEWRPGELGTCAKLTWEKVREIRSLRGTDSARAIGNRYGVSRSNIFMIWYGKTWKEEAS
jgi:hypothetical protein